MMLSPTTYSITYENTVALLTQIVCQSYGYEVEKGRSALVIYDKAGHKSFAVKLPLPFPAFTESLETYIEEVNDPAEPYLMLLIQAGHAALGYFQEEELVLHKTITRYMVRGNGKAQVTYLKQKGKSKAGSRVRLAQTIDFFEAINDKLLSWAVADECQRILYSAPIHFWNSVFSSKVAPPFKKDDPRLRAIPYDVNIPKMEELERINTLGLLGQVLLYGEKAFSIVAPYLLKQNED
ncbi:MAG: hypothetical protein ACFB0B_01200 [Thermonemataceae bacterium]